MIELTCIICPMGCSLSAEESIDVIDGLPVLNVTGNRCPRGSVYAKEEILAPKRVVTATCGIKLYAGSEEACPPEDVSEEVCPSHNLTAPRRVPVKTNIPCPKEKINELLEDIYSLKVGLPIKTGEVLISNWKDLGINVVAVRSIGL